MWQAWIARVLTLLLLPAALAAGEPQTLTSGFGETLEQAKQTGFFQWFMLEQTGVAAVNGGKEFLYQPSGERFHDLARVKVTTDGRGRIVAVELALQRGFVDSSSVGIYARDIAKSFLQSGVDPQDTETITKLVGEIDQLKGSSAPVIVHHDAVKPSPAGAPSEGYQVYLGKRDAFQVALPHGQTLDMENRPAEKKPSANQKTAETVLAIAFRARN
jgi:hypothetical protein